MRGQLKIISGKFQNNTINDVKQISLSHVIIIIILLYYYYYYYYHHHMRFTLTFN